MRPTIKITIYLFCFLFLVACSKEDDPVLEQVYFPKLIQFYLSTTHYNRTSTYFLNYNENNSIASIRILTSAFSNTYNTLLEFEYSGTNLSEIIATDISEGIVAESIFHYADGIFTGFDYITGGAEYNIDVTFNENENTFIALSNNSRTYSFDENDAFIGISGESINDYTLNFAMNRKAPFDELHPSPELVIWLNELDIGISDLYYFSAYFIESVDSENNFNDVQYENFETDSEGNLIKYATSSDSETSTCDIVYELRDKFK